MALGSSTQQLRSRSTQSIARYTSYPCSSFLHLVRPGQRASSSSSASAALAEDSSSARETKTEDVQETAGQPTPVKGKRLTKAQQQMLTNGTLLAQAIKASSSSSSTIEEPTSTIETEAQTADDINEPVPPPTLTGDRTTDFMALLTASTTPPPQPSISPDLRTLLTCRPSRPPRIHHKQYEWDYNGHFEKLNLAFLREQLVGMYEELRTEEARVLSGMDADFVQGKATRGLPILKRSAKKKEIIEAILSEWGWPPMREVRKEKKKREENRRMIDKRM